MDGGTLDTLIKGGEISVILACLYLIYKLIGIISGFVKTVTEALEKNTTAFNNHSASIDRLTERLPSLCHAREKMARQ